MAMAALDTRRNDDASARENREAAASAYDMDLLPGNISLIEEYIDTGLDAMLDEHTPTLDLKARPVDALPDRFAINLSQPLPHLNSTNAKAYAATNLQNPAITTYALVSDPKVPYRSLAIEALDGMIHPHLSSLQGYGPVLLSNLNEVRQVLFLTQPSGQTLADLLAQGTRFSERQLIHSILRPLCEALSAMRERGISHGKINPEHIFIGDRLILGECLSELVGIAQPWIYEPIERALCAPYNKGLAAPQTDSYAIAMLAYECMFGLERFKTLSETQLASIILEKGSFHFFTANLELNESLSDFFRGTLTENKEERWTIEQIILWLGGKRYNLIYPSLPNEASRPFTLNGAEYFNRRALANGLYRNWNYAVKELKDSKLDRWMEMSVHKTDMAESLERILSNAARTDRGLNEMVARTIITLHPNGPVRIKDIAFNVDSIGPTVSHYLTNNMHAELQTVLLAIDADLPNYSADITSLPKNETTVNLLWKLQRIRQYIKNNAIGFGIERTLYEVNPTLPCQSKLLLPYHCSTAQEVLFTLDALAPHLGKHESLLDRHLIAFIAAKLDFSKEVRFENLSKLASLKNHPELQALYFLAQAQNKNNKPRLIGLSCWAAKRLELLIENIQNRQVRKKLKKSLKSAAASGYIGQVVAILVENPLTKDDNDGFIRAARVFQHNMKRIELFKNPKLIVRASDDLGARISIFLGYIILFITSYVLADQYYLM